MAVHTRRWQCIDENGFYKGYIDLAIMTINNIGIPSLFGNIIIVTSSVSMGA